MKNSELIQNADGSIYHLHIDTKDINEIIITVGDPDRVEVVARHCDEIIRRKQKREFVTIIARIGQRIITIISTGIGTDNIDIVMNEIHALFIKKKKQETLDYSHLMFIRLGTSGSIQEGIKVNSLLVNTGALGLDLLMHYYDVDSDITDNALVEIENKLNLPLKPYYFRASEKLMIAFNNLENSYRGVALTASGFYAPQGRDLFNKTAYTFFFKKLCGHKVNEIPITNMEMETAAIYGMAKLLGHEAISINIILANRIDHTFSEAPKNVTEEMIQQSLDIIKTL